MAPPLGTVQLSLVQALASALNKKIVGPDSSVVEHLHGKQAVVGSIPILGRILN